MGIPDYILRKELKVVDRPGTVTTWIQINAAPESGVSWKEAVKLLLDVNKSQHHESWVFGFQIPVKFYQSMRQEGIFDRDPRNPPLGEEEVGYTLFGCKVKWKMT